MKKSKLIILLCFLTIISCKEHKTEAQSTSEKKVISEKVVAADFKAKIETKDVQLIDVRTPEEYNEAHIKNAKNIDFYSEQFYSDMSKLDKNKPLFIYCRSGGRSGKAATQLSKAGFDVYDLKGGFIDWQKQQYQIEK
jgi:phage shock protein E